VAQHKGKKRRLTSAPVKPKKTFPKEGEVIAMVERYAEPLCLSEGLELVHIEYQREAGGRVLRLYIDKPGGVALDDCVAVSRQLGDILDVGLEADMQYRLEVSSPGSERPLRKLADFERFQGRRAKIKLKEPDDGQRNFTGTLAGVAESRVKLLVDSKTVDFDIAAIQRARLVNQIGED
jgi:ribosome maturation factor RimP